MTLFVLDERTVLLLGAAYRHPTDLTHTLRTLTEKKRRKRREEKIYGSPRIPAAYITEK